MLTIAIPTFNRNDILKRNLENLFPQLSENCRVVIFDNHSDIPVQHSLKELLEEYSFLKIQIVRNRHNVGMTANILKCFELCEDQWLWILGDDDLVCPDAVENICCDIQSYMDAHCITYSWDNDTFQNRKTEISTHGVDEFIDTFETFGAVLFLSTSVYNMTKVSSGMAFAHFFQSSYAPHLAMLFMSLGEDGESIFSNKQIVSNMAHETPDFLKWDQIFIYQITLLLRLPLKAKTILKLRNRMVQLTEVWSIYHFIFNLTFRDLSYNDDTRPLVFYGEIVRSFFALDRRLSTRIAICIGYIVIRYPFFFRKFLAWIYKLVKGREFNPDNNLRI